MTTEFTPFAKMARLSREVIITEKIDGTNAQVFIAPVDSVAADADPTVLHIKWDGEIGRTIRAGSRSRWLTRQTDNFGFAKWVQENALDLFGLGEGQHFGEWWGSGIQRGYGLPKGEKRFSLFNTGRWLDHHVLQPGDPASEKMLVAPACCHVVPKLYRGLFITSAVEEVLLELARTGSAASPGFMNPEGIVIYHTAANAMFKKTIHGDDKPKSVQS